MSRSTAVSAVLAVLSGSMPAVQQQSMEILFERRLNYMVHFPSFGRDTLQKRYENLLAQRLHTVQRVPQHHIASCLDISSVRLRRISSEIAGKRDRGRFFVPAVSALVLVEALI